jgi:hypothetical protein
LATFTTAAVMRVGCFICYHGSGYPRVRTIIVVEGF